MLQKCYIYRKPLNDKLKPKLPETWLEEKIK